METYEIHNREVLLKALEICAGPDCHKSCPYNGRGARNKSCRSVLLEDAMAALTKDKADLDEMEASAIAYRDERDKLMEGWHDLCEERDKRGKECEELKEYALALEKEGQEARANGDKLREELATVNDQYRRMTTELSRLHADVDDLEAANHTLRAERDGLRIELEHTRNVNRELDAELHRTQQRETALLLKNSKQDAKTDRPSVGFDGNTAYWCGRADALAEVVGHMFEGEAPCK